MMAPVRPLSQYEMIDDSDDRSEQKCRTRVTCEMIERHDIVTEEELPSIAITEAERVFETKLASSLWITASLPASSALTIEQLCEQSLSAVPNDIDGCENGEDEKKRDIDDDDDDDDDVNRTIERNTDDDYSDECRSRDLAHRELRRNNRLIAFLHLKRAPSSVDYYDSVTDEPDFHRLMEFLPQHAPSELAAAASAADRSSAVSLFTAMLEEARTREWNAWTTAETVRDVWSRISPRELASELLNYLWRDRPDRTFVDSCRMRCCYHANTVSLERRVAEHLDNASLSLGVAVCLFGGNGDWTVSERLDDATVSLLRDVFRELMRRGAPTLAVPFSFFSPRRELRREVVSLLVSMPQTLCKPERLVDHLFCCTHMRSVKFHLDEECSMARARYTAVRSMLMSRMLTEMNEDDQFGYREPDQRWRELEQAFDSEFHADKPENRRTFAFARHVFKHHGLRPLASATYDEDVPAPAKPLANLAGVRVAARICRLHADYALTDAGRILVSAAVSPPENVCNETN